MKPVEDEARCLKTRPDETETETEEEQEAAESMNMIGDGNQG